MLVAFEATFAYMYVFLSLLGGDKTRERKEQMNVDIYHG